MTKTHDDQLTQFVAVIRQRAIDTWASGVPARTGGMGVDFDDESESYVPTGDGCCALGAAVVGLPILSSISASMRVLAGGADLEYGWFRVGLITGFDQPDQLVDRHHACTAGFHLGAELRAIAEQRGWMIT